MLFIVRKRLDDKSKRVPFLALNDFKCSLMEDDSQRDMSSPSEGESSYVLSTENDASSSWSITVASESSIEEDRLKKRRKLDPLPPERPDNVQTRKLRPPQHLRQQKEPTPSESMDSGPSSPEPGTASFLIF